MNNITTFTYEAGDLIKVKDPLNRETQRILDAAGRLRNLTNPLGQKTLYTPDALDRMTQLTDALNGATVFTYDANSNLLTVMSRLSGKGFSFDSPLIYIPIEPISLCCPRLFQLRLTKLSVGRALFLLDPPFLPG